jgi:hypothetical protein
VSLPAALEIPDGFAMSDEDEFHKKL